MRHYLTYRNEEYIVLGHNPIRNDCPLVRSSALEHQDLIELRRIVNSDQAQRSFYLPEVLQSEMHRTRQPWWSFLMREMGRRNGAVVILPLHEIQDGLDPEQRNTFKGYGKNRPSTGQLAEQEEKKRAKPKVDESYKSYAGDAEGYSEQSYIDDGYANRSKDRFDDLARTITQQNHETQNLLRDMITIMAANQQAKPKKAVRKAPARKKAQPVVESASA